MGHRVTGVDDGPGMIAALPHLLDEESPRGVLAEDGLVFVRWLEPAWFIAKRRA